MAIRFHMFLLLLACCFLGGCPNEGVLIIQPISGFSNRIRSLASASVVAKLTNRKLLVDWRLEQQGENSQMVAQLSDFFSNQFDTPASYDISPPQLAAIEAEQSYVLRDTGLTTHAFTPSNKKYIYIKNWNEFALENGDLDEERALRRQFIRSLIPVKAISEPLENFKNSYWPKTNGVPDNNKIIGVHVRLGNRPGDFGTIFDNPTSAEIIDKMKKLGEQYNIKTFFLASDTKSVINDIKQAFPADSILTFSSGTTDRNTVSGQQQDVVEWYLLGNSYVVLGTKVSSFSDVAAYLSTLGNKIEFGSGTHRLSGSSSR